MERDNELAGSTYLEDKLVLNRSSELGLTNCDSLVGRTLGPLSITQLSPGVFSTPFSKESGGCPCFLQKSYTKVQRNAVDSASGAV